MSMARTFGARSRACNSIRHYSSFDSSLRQNIPVPTSPVGSRPDTLPLSNSSVPPIPPKSPARRRSNSGTANEDYSDGSSSVAGPSRLSLDHYAASFGPRTFKEGSAGAEEEEGSETPRSLTPASSFYAKPRRRQPGQIATRDSSLVATMNGEEPAATPRADRFNALETHRLSDEGFDSRSNSTGSHSLRSHPPAPVDANLRSMPGVVGLGDGWAGGPQNQGKKRKLWFMKKAKVKEDEDPLALWSIQESGGDAHGLKAGQKRGMLKEAWNRSISKFGSMPALVSGEQVNGTVTGAKASVKALLSRSRLDVSRDDKTGSGAAVDIEDQDEKPSKRRSVAFFGSSKSQIDVSTSKPSPTATPLRSDTAPAPQSPPSPSPVPRGTLIGLSDSSRPRDTSNITPIAVPPRDNRRLSMPLSAPAVPGGLPPPWRPQSYIIPRPEPATPAPRPFSRHGDHAESEDLGETRDVDQRTPSMLEGPQTSGSSASAETPVTGSADGKSLKHKRSVLLASEDGHSGLGHGLSRTGTPLVPEGSRGRSAAGTPTFPIPRDPSTPGFDTLKDWAAEGKRPGSRALRPLRSQTPRSRELSSQSQQSGRSKWGSVSIFDKLKQALAVPETPSPGQAFSTATQVRQPAESQGMEMDKDLPEIPSRTSTPLNMPGAFPLDSPTKNSPLPASPYDITQAVAQEMLATPSPSRPGSRHSTRKRGLSGDIWSRRLSKISETNNIPSNAEPPSRASSRQEKRRSYSALAGRFGFTAMRRNSLRADDEPDRLSGSDGHGAVTMLTPALEALEFGDDSLGLDDILDEDRRISLVRDLEASLPMPPARSEPSDTSSPTKSVAMTISSSEATVLAAPITLGSPTHRSHPSTSTSASRSSVDRDETVLTPSQLRRSLEKPIEARRGSQQSDDVERTFSMQPWPTRGHRRGASMGSIGELAHDMLHKPLTVSKRASVVSNLEDEESARRMEREERTMSFASGVSSLSSAMSLDEEEAGEFSDLQSYCPAARSRADICSAHVSCPSGVTTANQTQAD